MHMASLALPSIETAPDHKLFTEAKQGNSNYIATDQSTPGGPIRGHARHHSKASIVLLCAGLLLVPSRGEQHCEAADEALLPAGAGLAALLEDDWLLQFAASQLGTPTAAAGAGAAQVRMHAESVSPACTHCSADLGLSR